MTRETPAFITQSASVLTASLSLQNCWCSPLESQYASNLSFEISIPPLGTLASPIPCRAMNGLFHMSFPHLVLSCGPKAQVSVHPSHRRKRRLPGRAAIPASHRICSSHKTRGDMPVQTSPRAVLERPLRDLGSNLRTQRWIVDASFNTTPCQQILRVSARKGQAVTPATAHKITTSGNRWCLKGLRCIAGLQKLTWYQNCSLVRIIA